MADEILWTFYGYVTPAGTQDVQMWFWRLQPDAQDELLDALAYLERLPPSQWKRPRFALLGGGLSEIRVTAHELGQVYRLYGIYWPQHHRYVYTFLLGHDKKVRNPKHDIDEARSRQRKLETGKASIHVFDFSIEPHK